LRGSYCMLRGTMSECHWYGILAEEFYAHAPAVTGAAAQPVTIIHPSLLWTLMKRTVAAAPRYRHYRSCVYCKQFMAMAGAQDTTAPSSRHCSEVAMVRASGIWKSLYSISFLGLDHKVAYKKGRSWNMVVMWYMKKIDFSLIIIRKVYLEHGHRWSHHF
jgi:hypothetical protein